MISCDFIASNAAHPPIAAAASLTRSRPASDPVGDDEHALAKKKTSPITIPKRIFILPPFKAQADESWEKCGPFLSHSVLGELQSGRMMSEAPKSSHRTKVAILLMIVPLLLAIGIRFWPSQSSKGFPDVSRILLVRTEVRGTAGKDLADTLTQAIRTNCDGKLGVAILPSTGTIEAPDKGASLAAMAKAHAADALLFTAITGDAGLIEVDLQLIRPDTGQILWRDAYQASQEKWPELSALAAQKLLQ